MTHQSHFSTNSWRLLATVLSFTCFVRTIAHSSVFKLSKEKLAILSSGALIAILLTALGVTSPIMLAEAAPPLGCYSNSFGTLQTITLDPSDTNYLLSLDSCDYTMGLTITASSAAPLLNVSILLSDCLVSTALLLTANLNISFGSRFEMTRQSVNGTSIYGLHAHGTGYIRITDLVANGAVTVTGAYTNGSELAIVGAQGTSVDIKCPTCINATVTILSSRFDYINITATTVFENMRMIVANSSIATYLSMSVPFVRSNILVDSFAAQSMLVQGAMNYSSFIVRNTSLTGNQYSVLNLHNTWLDTMLHIADSSITGTAAYAIYISKSPLGLTTHRFTGNVITNALAVDYGTGADPRQGCLAYEASAYFGPGSRLLLSNNTFKSFFSSVNSFLLFASVQGGQVIHEDTNRGSGASIQIITVESSVPNTPPHRLHFHNYTGNRFWIEFKTRLRANDSVSFVDCTAITMWLLVGLTTGMTLEIVNTRSTFYIYDNGFYPDDGYTSAANITLHRLWTTYIQMRLTLNASTLFSVTESTMGWAIQRGSCSGGVSVVYSKNNFTKNLVLERGLYNSTLALDQNTFHTDVQNSLRFLQYPMLDSAVNVTNNYMKVISAPAVQWDYSDVIQSSVQWTNNICIGSGSFNMSGSAIGQGGLLLMRDSVFDGFNESYYSAIIFISGGRIDHDGSNRHLQGKVVVTHNETSGGNNTVLINASTIASFLYYEPPYQISESTSVGVLNSAIEHFVKISLGTTTNSTILVDGARTSTSVEYPTVTVEGSMMTSTISIRNTIASSQNSPIDISCTMLNSSLLIDHCNLTTTGAYVIALNSLNLEFTKVHVVNSNLHCMAGSTTGGLEPPRAVIAFPRFAKFLEVEFHGNVFSSADADASYVWVQSEGGNMIFNKNNTFEGAGKWFTNFSSGSSDNNIHIHGSPNMTEVLIAFGNELGRHNTLMISNSTIAPFQQLPVFGLQIGFTLVLRNITSSQAISLGSQAKCYRCSITLADSNLAQIDILAPFYFYDGCLLIRSVSVKGYTSISGEYALGSVTIIESEFTNSLNFSDGGIRRAVLGIRNIKVASFAIAALSVNNFYSTDAFWVVEDSNFTGSASASAIAWSSSPIECTSLVWQRNTADGALGFVMSTYDVLAYSQVIFKSNNFLSLGISSSGGFVDADESNTFVVERLITYNTSVPLQRPPSLASLPFIVSECDPFTGISSSLAASPTSSLIIPSTKSLSLAQTHSESSSDSMSHNTESLLEADSPSLNSSVSSSGLLSISPSQTFSKSSSPTSDVTDSGSDAVTNSGSVTNSGVVTNSGAVTNSGSASDTRNRETKSLTISDSAPTIKATASLSMAKTQLPPPQTTFIQTLSDVGFGYRYFVHDSASYPPLTGDQYGLNLLFTQTFATWNARRFLSQIGGGGAVRVRVASSTGVSTVRVATSKTSLAVDSITVNGVQMQNFIGSSSALDTDAFTKASCGHLIPSSESVSVSASTIPSLSVVFGPAAQKQFCRSAISYAGMLYSNAPFADAPRWMYVYFPANESYAADASTFLATVWKGAGANFTVYSNSSIVMIGNATSPGTTTMVTAASKRAAFLAPAHSSSVSVSTETHSTVACVVANQGTFNATLIPLNAIVPVVGIATNCFLYDTVDDLHYACLQTDSCYGFTTILMRTPQVREMPLCMYVGSAASTSGSMAYPRMFYAKPSQTPQTCATTVQKSGKVAVYIQQTMMASGLAVVRVNGNRVAQCGSSSAFANGFLGGDARCQQWALCYVGAVPSNANISVSTVTKLDQGGCENSLGVMLSQLSIDQVEVTAPTQQPVRYLNVTGLGGREVRKYAQTTDPIKVFVLNGLSAALSVTQTHFKCTGVACLTAPNVSMNTQTSCQRCGGSAGFLDGLEGLSDRCDSTQFCGDFMALAGSSSSSCLAAAASAHASPYTGWITLSAPLPTITGDEGDCAGFMGTVYSTTSGEGPTYPFLDPLSGAVATLHGRTSGDPTAPNGAIPLLTLTPLVDPIQVSYVPSWYESRITSLQTLLPINSTQVCILDHSKELEAQCTFYIPVGATYVSVKAAQTDFALKQMTVSLFPDGETSSSTTACGGTSLFSRSAGQQERCDLYSTCLSRYIYSNDTAADGNTNGKVVVSFPRGLRSYACDFVASVVVDFSRPNVEAVSCNEGAFECEGERKCIQSDFVCDGIQDCESGSDEQPCVKLSVLPNETFCTDDDQQTTIATKSQLACTREAIRSGSTIHYFNGSHCTVFLPSASTMIHSDPLRYLCATTVSGVTTISLTDPASFALCRSSIQCSGNGVATFVGGVCGCQCDELFSGGMCEVPLRLDHITEVVCVTGSVTNTLSVSLPAVAKVLKLGSSYAAVTCTSVVRGIDDLGGSILSISCQVSSTRGRASDITSHYRRLQDQAMWPSINASLISASLPPLRYLSGRTAMTPTVFTSECTSDATCSLNRSDHMAVTIASNVSISSLSIDLYNGGDEDTFSSTSRRTSTSVSCEMASMTGSSGCLLSTCDVPIDIPQNASFSIVSLNKDDESLLTTRCSAEGVTVQGRLAVGNVDTFTNDTSVQTSEDYIAYFGVGLALFGLTAVGWMVAAVAYKRFNDSLARLQAQWGRLMAGTPEAKLRMLLTLRLHLECEERGDLRMDRLATVLGIAGTVMAVLAGFLVLYKATGSNVDSNFSVMYEEYSDEQCERSATSYMPRRLFVASVDSSCDRMLTYGESVGSAYATGECSGSYGSYEARFKMASAAGTCRSRSEVTVASGSCVPLQYLDPSSSRSVFVRLVCSSTVRIQERIQALRAYDGNIDVFVSGDVSDPSPRLAHQQLGNIYQTPFLVGQDLLYSTAYSNDVLATQASSSYFDGDTDSRRVVYQSTSPIPASLLASRMISLTPSSLPELPAVPEVPIGYFFGGFGASEPVTWAGAGPTAQRYYSIAGSPFDMGSYFPADPQNPQDGEGYAISLWMMADSTTLGFAYAVTDALENWATMSVQTLEGLAATVDSGSSGQDWYNGYRVYHSLYVDGPGRSLTVAYASPTFTARVALLRFELSTIGAEHVVDGKWHHIAITFTAENKKVRAQLIVDGQTSYSKEGWGDCVDELPEPIHSFANSFEAEVFDRVTDRVTRGGLLVIGYFSGAVYGLRAHTKSMLNTDFLPTGTQLMRDRNAFSRSSTLALGVFLLSLSFILFVVFAHSTVSRYKAHGDSSEGYEVSKGAKQFESLMEPLFAANYTPISFTTALRWAGLTANDLCAVMEECSMQKNTPAEFMALLLLQRRKSGGDGDDGGQQLTLDDWNPIVVEDEESQSDLDPSVPIHFQSSQVAEEGIANIKISASVPDGNQMSFGTSSTSSGGTDIAAKLLAPIVGVFQGMYVWSSSISLPSLYDDYFSGLFAFASVDIAGVFPSVAPLITSIVQVLLGLAVLALVAYLLFEDERSFNEHLTRYVWRRDSLVSVATTGKPIAMPTELSEALEGHPLEPFGVAELNILPTSSAYKLDCFNGKTRLPDAADATADATAAADDISTLSEVTVLDSTGQRVVVSKAVPSTTKGQLLMNSEPLPIVGVRCYHHGHVLTGLNQTDVWPLTNRAHCCVKGCGVEVGTLFSCGMEVPEVERGGGPPSVCQFALCETHYHLPVKDNLSLVVRSLLRSLRTNSVQWFLCVVGITLANAAYTPIMNTALMIVACHPYYQCEFQCWGNMNQKFALAAFLAFVTIGLLGLGLPLTLFSFLYRRNEAVKQNSLGPEYEGRYTDPVTAGLHLDEWRRFVASDHSAMSSLYTNLHPKWLFFPPLLVICKAALLVPPIAIEPRSLDQRIGCAVVQIAITLLLFATNPYASSIQMQSMRAAELHQLIQLGLQNIDLVVRNDSNRSLALPMIIITLVYVVANVLVALAAVIFPIWQKQQREGHLSLLMPKVGLIFSGGISLYVESVQPIGRPMDNNTIVVLDSDDPPAKYADKGCEQSEIELGNLPLENVGHPQFSDSQD